MGDYEVSRETVESHHPIHKVPLGSVIEVEWVDSERVFLGWADPDEYTKALVDRTTYRSTGYLINVTGHALLLVMNRSDSGMVGEGMVIPLAAVKSVAALSTPRTETSDE